MVRIVIGILAGYAAIAVFVMVSFTLLWLGIGQERAFHPGTTRVTTTWLAFSLPLNLLAAALGGWIAARVSRPRPHSAVLGLIGVLMILGGWAALSQAVGVQGDLPPTLTPAPDPDLGPLAAASLAVQPLWFAWVLPILGAVGAWAGGSLFMLRDSRAPR